MVVGSFACDATHYIVEGRCRAQVDGEIALDLAAGGVVVFPRDCASGGWLESSIRQAVAAAAPRQARADVVLAPLSEALFVETLRQSIESLREEQKGWLAGLRDPFVANALKLIHRSPAQSWTVDEIARSVGCSRSVIAERFAHYLGQPPIQYLTSWRFSLAASRLRAGGLPPARVAELEKCLIELLTL